MLTWVDLKIFKDKEPDQTNTVLFYLYKIQANLQWLVSCI